MVRPKIYDVEELKAFAVEYLKEEPYPTIVNLCVRFGISKQRFYELAAENKGLSDIAKEIGTKREDVLERSGLSGDFNPAMTKFALAQIGWTEKQEVKQETVQINIDKSDADSVL